MLVTIICLAEWRQLMLEARLETIFDCMDFSNNGQISSDEMVSQFQWIKFILIYITDSVILLHCLMSLRHSPKA